MPIYVYACPECGRREEHMRKIEERDEYVGCHNKRCLNKHGRDIAMVRIITPVHGRVDAPADGSTPRHHGGPDQFTADALGFTKKQLMENEELSGLRAEGPGKI